MARDRNKTVEKRHGQVQRQKTQRQAGSGSGSDSDSDSDSDRPAATGWQQQAGSDSDRPAGRQERRHGLTDGLVECLGVEGRAERINLVGGLGDGGGVLLQLFDLGRIVVDSTRNLSQSGEVGESVKLAALVEPLVGLWVGRGQRKRGREKREELGWVILIVMVHVALQGPRALGELDRMIILPMDDEGHCHHAARSRVSVQRWVAVFVLMGACVTVSGTGIRG